MRTPFIYAVGLFSLVCLASGCFVMDNKYSKVAPGIWRGVLQLENNGVVIRKKLKPFEAPDIKFEEVANGELPFQFEVNYLNDSIFEMTIINGEERIKVEKGDILTGHNLETGQDTILIQFRVYDTYIHAVYKENVIEGEWVVPAKSMSIPFIAHNGKGYRFTSVSKKPLADISGHWETTFGVGDSVPEKAVGEFKQNGNTLRGTFRTETGDYRYLDGEVQGDRIYLSCFDGSHAFLFEGKIKADGSLIGSFHSGKSYRTIWVAKRNEQYELANPDSLTIVKSGGKSVDFAFKNPEGRVISLHNSEYQNKVKVVEIMGTWCPNCRDEANFLKEYLAAHVSDEVAVVALAYERSKDTSKSNALIRLYKERMGTPYEVVDAGTSNKEEASKTMPMLNKISAFPTTIIIDKKNRVRKIHTGFDGPATSRYGAFKKDFEAFIQALVAEKA